MTKDTYVARFMATNHASFSNGDMFRVAFGIKNTSDYDVEIRKIYTESMFGWDVAQTSNPISVWRTTSDSQGEGVTSLKHDTNATLPAQVSCAKHGSVTTSALINHPGQGLGTRLTATNGAIWSSRHSFVPPWSAINGTFKSGGFVQPVVLQEGQGVAVINDSPSMRPRSQFVHVMFRRQDTGDTFTASSYNAPAGERDVMLSLFNGSGSGIVLEVMRIESHDFGIGTLNSSDTDASSNQPSQATSSFRLALVSDLIDGEIVTPAAFDTANVLPSGISCYRGGSASPLPGGSTNQAAGLLQENTGVINTTTFLAFQRINALRLLHSHVLEGWQLGSTGYPRRVKGGAFRELYRSPGDGQGFFVKKGACFALLWWARPQTTSLMQASTFSLATGVIPFSGDENASTLSNFNLNVEFAVTPGAGTPVTGAVLSVAGGSFIS